MSRVGKYPGPYTQRNALAHTRVMAGLEGKRSFTVGPDEACMWELGEGFLSREGGRVVSRPVVAIDRLNGVIYVEAGHGR